LGDGCALKLHGITIEYIALCGCCQGLFPAGAMTGKEATGKHGKAQIYAEKENDQPHTDFTDPSDFLIFPPPKIRENSCNSWTALCFSLLFPIPEQQASP
jgi:hypothetical protein